MSDITFMEMHFSFKKIKSIGFDLDETLYPPNQEINDRIRNEIAKRISEKMPEFNTLEKARQLYEESYKKWKSGSIVLRNLGFKNPEEVMHECLSNANVIDLVERDSQLIQILGELKERYELFLITGSPGVVSLQKLKKIGFSPQVFNDLIFGDTWPGAKKIDGSVFREFLKKSKHQAEEHVYVGDNLTSDILPAKSAGMKTIAIGLKTREADVTLENIYQIKKIFLP